MVKTFLSWDVPRLTLTYIGILFKPDEKSFVLILVTA